MSADVIKCYLHAKKGFLLIPTAYNSAGIGKSINRPQTLAAPVGDEQLGAALRLSRQWCDYALFENTASIPEVTAAGGRSWSHFARASQLVLVAFEKNIRLTPTTRDAHGGYWFLVNQEAELHLTVTDAELGAAIRLALSRCREGPRE